MCGRACRCPHCRQSISQKACVELHRQLIVFAKNNSPFQLISFVSEGCGHEFDRRCLTERLDVPQAGVRLNLRNLPTTHDTLCSTQGRTISGGRWRVGKGLQIQVGEHRVPSLWPAVSTVRQDAYVIRKSLLIRQSLRHSADSL